jgi:hypothetical protein
MTHSASGWRPESFAARTKFFASTGVNPGAFEALSGMDHHAATILVVEDHRACSSPTI